MNKVDQFGGTKKDKEFLYLDEMLTRALISLDDIDPDGNNEIRLARKALIKDINSKISLLEKKATKEKSPSNGDNVSPAASNAVSVVTDATSQSSEAENGQLVSKENAKNSGPSKDKPIDRASENFSSVDCKTAIDGAGEKAMESSDGQSCREKAMESSEGQSCREKTPAPAIPLPDK